MRQFWLAILLLNGMPACAQDSMRPAGFQFSGYVEAYYCYDSERPADHARKPVFYNYSRHNEVDLNLGFVKASYSQDRVRANFALMAGTYAQANLASEPLLLRHVFEANAGWRMPGRHEVWLDAGIMPAHIGFESAIGSDCWTLTRSILADNSPYYEAGLKLGFLSADTKWKAAILYLNGWQRVQRLAGNNTPAFGTQLSYSPGDKAIVNWSAFIGNEYPDSARRWRYFNNLYAKFQLAPKLGLIVGFDIGLQQERKGSSRLDTWYSPILIVRYRVRDRIHLAARLEYYRDRNALIISPMHPYGLDAAGGSINLDYAPARQVLVRIEGRGLYDANPVFLIRDDEVRWNFFVTASCSVSF